MKRWGHKQQGFTIVELLIVIVVIGILAAITVVSYRGSQDRARDSARQNSLTDIRNALEAYRAENNAYPDEAVSGQWEYSYTNPANFLSALKPYMGSVPVDPINTSSSYFYYHRYETSGGGVTCPSARGAYYVLGVVGLSTVRGTDISTTWNCENGAAVPTNTAWIPTTTRAVWGAFTF